MSVNISKTKSGIKFTIRVIPKSSKNAFSLMEEGAIKLKITAPPVDGKANETCVKFIANVLSVSKSSIKIISGLKSKTKIIEVEGDSDALYARLIEFLDND